MSCFVVVEGRFDSEYLEPLLDDLRGSVSFRVVLGGGLSGADSLARSLAIDGHEVAELVDADSNDDERIKQRQQYLESSLQQASPHENWRVFLAVPELEAIFFREKSILKGLKPALQDDLLDMGQLAPREALKKLNIPRPDLVQALKTHPCGALREQTPVKELRAFLQELARQRVSK